MYGDDFKEDIGSNWYYKEDRILSYPDLQERIEQWRIEHGMSENFEEECPQQQNNIEQEGMSIDPETELDAEFKGKTSTLQQNILGRSITKPQHPFAKTIFRKRSVKIRVFDNGIIDGDTIQIYVNTGVTKNLVTLKPYPGEEVELYLQESSKKAPLYANTLYFKPISGGSFFEPDVTIGVAVDDPDMVFEGSEILPRIDSKGDTRELEFEAGVFEEIPVLKFALGLVCISSRNPESIRHINRATAPDFGGGLQATGWPRILTLDRNTLADPTKTNRRSRQSKNEYKDLPLPQAKPGQDLDEYPPAVFLENLGAKEHNRADGKGKAHVMPIDSSDNRRSGREMQSYFTGPGGRANPIHRNGGQVEIVTPGFGLFCVDAF